MGVATSFIAFLAGPEEADVQAEEGWKEGAIGSPKARGRGGVCRWRLGLLGQVIPFPIIGFLFGRGRRRETAPARRAGAAITSSH
jgi:hypothetical protein